jgi:hypothetical protein
VWVDQIETKVRDLLNCLIAQYNKFLGEDGLSNIVVDIGRSNVNLLNVHSECSKEDIEPSTLWQRMTWNVGRKWIDIC